MAVWEVRPVFQYGDRFWENIWHVDAGADTDVAPALISAFVDFSLETLLDLYSLARVVRRPAGSHDEFIEVIVAGAGLVGAGDNLALPLFNVARILLSGGVGRPGEKLLRGLLLNSDVIDNQNHIKPALVSYVTGKVDDLFNAASTAGQSIVFGATDKVAVSPIVDSTIQMRQLHRKRKKTV
jgi:hypothetical protein